MIQGESTHVACAELRKANAHRKDTGCRSG